MKFNREKMAKALAECHGGACFSGCYLFDTAIKDEQMRCMNCLNIANEVIKELTERNEILEAKCKVNDRIGKAFIKRGKQIKKLTEENEQLGALKEHLDLVVEGKLKRTSALEKQVMKLTEENENLHASCTELTRKCASLTEENDRLASALAEYDRITEVRIAEEYVSADAYEELREENERLKSVEFTCGFVKPHKVLECPIFDEIARTRADTVRKMRERLKDKFKDCLGVPYIIDQIAKEMEESGYE